MDTEAKDFHYGGSTRDSLSSDLKTIIEDAEALLKATASHAGEDAASARRKVKAALDKAKQRYTEVEGRAIAQAKATDAMIRSHPYETLGLAFGAGMLVGLLLNRRS